MKIRYTEELLKGVIEHQVFPNESEEVSEFSLDHLVIGQLIKANGEKSLLNCILDINKQGILAVLLDSSHGDKVKGYHYFEFSNMQGIKINKKKLFYYIILQFTDGTNYVFRIMKQSTKYLPNQSRNIHYIISILNDQNLNDMNNIIYKRKVIKDKKIASIYIVTLIFFEMIAMILFLKYAPNSFFLIFILVLAAIIHFIVFIVAALYVDKRKDRHFVKEYNQIMKAYSKTDNAEIFLNELSSIKNPPKTTQSANVFHLSMSTALYKNNKKEEALSYLDKVDTSDGNFQNVIGEQRRMIEDEENRNI